jgi:hypothetical protein
LQGERIRLHNRLLKHHVAFRRLLFRLDCGAQFCPAIFSTDTCRIVRQNKAITRHCTCINFCVTAVESKYNPVLTFHQLRGRHTIRFPLIETWLLGRTHQIADSKSHRRNGFLHTHLCSAPFYPGVFETARRPQSRLMELLHDRLKHPLRNGKSSLRQAEHSTYENRHSTL